MIWLFVTPVSVFSTVGTIIVVGTVCVVVVAVDVSVVVDAASVLLLWLRLIFCMGCSEFAIIVLSSIDADAVGSTAVYFFLEEELLFCFIG